LVSKFRRISNALNLWFQEHAIQECLFKDVSCSGGVIRAHSIQNAAILDLLAVAGHVYMFKLLENGAKLKRIGRNRSTVFTGLCSNHDSQLFKEIDFINASQFDPTNKRQLILLSLRSLARECWAKLNGLKLFSQINEAVNRKDTGIIKQLLNTDNDCTMSIINSWHLIGEPLSKEFRASSQRICKVFVSFRSQTATRRYHLTRAQVFKIQGPPSVAVSSIFAPGFDLEGNILNEFREGYDIADIILNIIPTSDFSWVVFTYHKRHESRLSQFFEQLHSLTPEGLAITMSKMILIHCENAVFSPNFVKQLSEIHQRKLEVIWGETISCVYPFFLLPFVNFFPTFGGSVT